MPVVLDAIEEATLQKQIVDPQPMKESSSQVSFPQLRHIQESETLAAQIALHHSHQHKDDGVGWPRARSKGLDFETRETKS